MRLVSNRIVIFAMAGFFLLVSDSYGQTAAEVQARVATTYENLGAMSASFVQVATSDFMDGPERFSGTLLFSGKKYRVQTASQTIVTDGNVLWIYNKSEKQVIINDFVQDETSFSLTSMLQQLGKNYDASLEDSVIREGVKHVVLKLVPTSDDVQFQQVILHIRSTDSVVTHLEVLDFNDVLMVFALSDVEVNPKVDAASFSFTPPPGVERIDLRN